MASTEVVTCEWCRRAPASGKPMAIGNGLCPVDLCEGCRPRAARFSAAVAGIEGPLLGTDWLPNGRPDLVIHLAGRSPATVKDARTLKTKALRGLLPTPPKAAKRKAAKQTAELSPTEQVQALAKRRRELEQEREHLNGEIRTLVERAQTDRSLSVAAIARTLGLSRQRLYQLAG